jgi:hypothetical protein
MLRPLLTALLKAVRRDLAGYASLKTNNFFLFVVMMIWGALNSGVAPIASYPFLVALGTLMILPASGDPLDKIPPSRFSLWPLTGVTRVMLRILGLLLNPAFWILAALIALRSGPAIAAVFVAFIATARLFPWARPTSFVALPGSGLITKDLRQLLTVLDTWLALAIGLGGGLWRVLSSHPDPDAFPILAILVALALSTCAQSLFALDGETGLTRYRLLPLRGWQVVLAKDAAFLAILLLAVLPLSVPRGLSFGLAALALGRYPAMRLRLPQQRWRFTSGRVLWGVLQSVAGIGLPLIATAPLYAASLWWAAREWDRR